MCQPVKLASKLQQKQIAKVLAASEAKELTDGQVIWQITTEWICNDPKCVNHGSADVPGVSRIKCRAAPIPGYI